MRGDTDGVLGRHRHENLETLPSVGARSPRIRLASDPLCFDLCLGLLPTTTSLGCEMVAMRSQLTFYKESIRQRRQPRPRFHPAFRLLWVLLSRIWTGWKSAAELMKPKTVLQWHEHAFLQWWRWKSRRKGGRPTTRQEMRALIRRLSRENVLWSAPWQNPFVERYGGTLRRELFGSRDGP
jgi:hypothetical protein